MNKFEDILKLYDEMREIISDLYESFYNDKGEFVEDFGNYNIKEKLSLRHKSWKKSLTILHVINEKIKQLKEAVVAE